VRIGGCDLLFDFGALDSLLFPVLRTKSAKNKSSRIKKRGATLSAEGVECFLTLL
jgi:hypothetical protein